LEIACGSGAKHWLELGDCERAPLLDYQTFLKQGAEPVRSRDERLDRGDVTRHVRLHESAHFATSIQLHLLEINWDAPPTAIKKAFADWVDSKPTWKAERERRKAKPGRKGKLSPLVDLAILRVSGAGITCKEGEKILWPLLVKAKAERRAEPSHWADAKRGARAMIEQFRRDTGGIMFLARQFSDNSKP
jgi:hypothetical protein